MKYILMKNRHFQKCLPNQKLINDLTGLPTISAPRYSRLYDICRHFPGNLPCFRTGTNPALSLRANKGPKINPRDSNPTTTSTLSHFSSSTLAAMHSMTYFRHVASFKRENMSRKTIPFLGKSG